MHVQAAGINSSQPEIDLELVNAIETISKIDKFADRYDRFKLARFASKIALSENPPGNPELVKIIYERRITVAESRGFAVTDDMIPPNQQYAIAGLMFPNTQIGLNEHTGKMADFTDKQKLVAGFAALNGRIPNEQELSLLLQDV